MTRVIILVSGLFLIGCAYLQPTHNSRDAAREESRVSEPDSMSYANLPFDPLSLGPSIFASYNLRPAEAADESSPKLTPRANGYRVQLGAFIEQERANNLATRAESDLNARSYVVFDRPFYRVRVGNCRTMEAAENLKRTAISAGYADARIASDEVDSDAE